MKCPFCRVDNDRVIDSRSSQDGLAIRRRRECLHCNRRFTTYERPEETTIKVIKKDVTDSDRYARGGRLPKKKRALPGKEQKKTEITVPKASKRVIRISDVISVSDLAKQMGIKVGEILKKLMDMGVMATINQALDFDTATLVATDFEYAVENVAFEVGSSIVQRRPLCVGR